jgi:redox-regulated HSP33 family molecular chaperone
MSQSQFPDSGLDSISAVTRDRRQKVVTQDGQAVVIALDATQLTNDSMSRIGAWPPAMIHLGQAMLGTLLMQALPDRDESERTELQWKSAGPFGSLFSESRGVLVRGTIMEPRAPVQDLKSKLGPGLLQVRRVKKAITTGIVQAQGDVTLDILEYLERSEQKNCAMNLWVDVAWEDRAEGLPFRVRRALGYLVHVLPQPSEERMNQVLFQWDRHLTSLGPLSKWVLGEDPTSDMLSYISAELHPRVVASDEVAFFCTCTEERAERALALLTDIERHDGEPDNGPNKGQPSEVRCEFCGRTYLL